jgi:hypothetical protein
MNTIEGLKKFLFAVALAVVVFLLAFCGRVGVT